LRFISNTALLPIAIVLSFIAGCEKQDKRVSGTIDDPVVHVSEGDAEMAAAISQARQSLPHFWEVFEKPTRGEDHFALKVKITDEHGTEHFWANELQRQDGKISGTINNDPNIVKSVKLGDRIEITADDISDWMYMRDGKMVGNRTMVPLFKSMPPEEVEQFKSMMAEP
jgi:uncharacterized protein YegJ (DUF2314 family)